MLHTKFFIYSSFIYFNNTYVDNEEDLDVVISVYNLLEYSDNYAKTNGNICHYTRDNTEYTDGANPLVDPDNLI